jgi:hypothetical protein
MDDDRATDTRAEVDARTLVRRSLVRGAGRGGTAGAGWPRGGDSCTVDADSDDKEGPSAAMAGAATATATDGCFSCWRDAHMFRLSTLWWRWLDLELRSPHGFASAEGFEFDCCCCCCFMGRAASSAGKSLTSCQSACPSFVMIAAASACASSAAPMAARPPASP